MATAKPRTTRRAGARKDGPAVNPRSARAKEATKRSVSPRRSVSPKSAIGPASLALGTSLTIREVVSSLGDIREALTNGVRAIDVTALEVLDTAGVQLLLAMLQAAESNAIPLRLVGAEKLLFGAADALGLGRPFTAAMEISA